MINLDKRLTLVESSLISISNKLEASIKDGTISEKDEIDVILKTIFIDIEKIRQQIMFYDGQTTILNNMLTEVKENNGK